MYVTVVCTDTLTIAYSIIISLHPIYVQLSFYLWALNCALVFSSWHITPGVHYLKERRFNLTHHFSFGEFSSFLASSVSCPYCGREKRGTKILSLCWPEDRVKKWDGKGQGQELDSDPEALSLDSPDLPRSACHQFSGRIPNPANLSTAMDTVCFQFCFI